MSDPTIIESAMLAAALTYAARGWHVFPCHHMRFGANSQTCSCGFRDCKSPGKHPRTPRGLHDATDDAAQLRRWWGQWPNANVGVVTGAVSGVVVLDVDIPKGGDVSLAEVFDEHGTIPETVEAHTGGGGRHVFFTHPGRPVKNSEGEDGWVGKRGLDFRGDGGYVVASPSNHRSGIRYAWCEGMAPDEHAVAAMPDWLLGLYDAHHAPKVPKADPRPNFTPDAELWLGKALAKAHEGQRNKTGFNLACQLRDDGLSEDAARQVMLDYARRVERGQEPYGESEAMASLRSAFKDPPRAPAMSLEARRSAMIRSSHPKSPAEAPAAESSPPPATAPVSAGAELRKHIAGIVSGEIKDVGLPFPDLTRLTQPCLPGTITVLCGDPGIGKTFWSLDCLRYWLGKGVDTAAFFIEKDRKFYTHRLLAQLEGSGQYIGYDWIAANPQLAEAAMNRHEAQIDDIGKHIASDDGDRLTLDGLANWVRQMASAGKRTIIIDPISAADAGRDRWMADDLFLYRANKIVTAHACSLMLVQHPKKGNRSGPPTGHDIGNGAAYNKFVDNIFWLHKPTKPRKVMVATKFGGIQRINLEISCSILKARHGTGSGVEVAMGFDHSLHYAEYGVVLKDANDQGHGVEPAWRDAAGPGVPQMANTLDDVP